MNLDLNLLPHLKALLQTQSVTRAADSLGISQPAMSASLRKLRIHFNDPLLERSGNDMVCTPFAAGLLPLAREAMSVATRASDYGRKFDPGTSDREFLIGGSDYAAAVLTPALVRAIGEHAPAVRVTFSPARRFGGADVVVAPEGYAHEGERSRAFADAFVVVVDRDHPLAAPEARVEELAHYPSAAPDFGAPVVSPVDRVLGELGIRRHVVATAPGLTWLAPAVRGTSLVAYVPSMIAAPAVESGALVARSFPELVRPRLVESVFVDPRLHDPAVEWIHDRLVEAGESLTAHEYPSLRLT